MSDVKQRDFSPSSASVSAVQSSSDPTNDSERLKTLFDFTNEDLAINRRGKLSARQVLQHGKRVFNQQLDQRVQWISAAIFLICFAVFIVFAQIYGSQIGPLVLVGIVVWLVVILILISLVRLFANRMRSNYAHNDKPDAQIDPHILKQSKGVLKVINDGEHTHVMLNHQELTNSAESDAQAALWKLEPQKRYIIYYVEQPFWVVAVESVPT